MQVITTSSLPHLEFSFQGDEEKISFANPIALQINFSDNSYSRDQQMVEMYKQMSGNIQLGFAGNSLKNLMKQKHGDVYKKLEEKMKIEIKFAISNSDAKILSDFEKSVKRKLEEKLGTEINLKTVFYSKEKHVNLNKNYTEYKKRWDYSITCFDLQQTIVNAAYGRGNDGRCIVNLTLKKIAENEYCFLPFIRRIQFYEKKNSATAAESATEMADESATAETTETN